MFPVGVAECFFAKTAAVEDFDNRDEIEFRIDHFFELGGHFDLIGGGDIASKNRFLVVFEVLFTDFKYFGDAIFSYFAKFIGDIVKQKDVVVVCGVLFHSLSLSEKGRNSRPSTMVLISLYPSSLIACL